MAIEPWPTVSIGEVCDGIFDGPHATPAKIDSGAVFLGIWNIENGRIDLSTTEHISEADWPRWTRRVEPTEGDLVFSYETKLGCGALIPAGLRCCLGRRMALARPNRRKVDPRFLLYTFLAPEFQESIRNYTISGSTVDRIPLLEFPKFPMKLPPLPEQRAIARVLGGLDDKIELNRRMNRTLEDLARGVFRSWFVDFDPVLRPAPGPPSRPPSPPPVPPARRGGPASPAPRSAPAAPAPPHAPWPTRLTDSPLGPIPEGWRVGTVADLCTTQYGYTASATDDAVGPRMLRVTDMNKEPWVEWADVPHCRIDDDLLPRYALKLGDVLVSRMADPGKAAIVEEVLPEGAVFASYLIRLATRSIAASYYLFYYLRSDQYLDYAESVSGGTVQKNMNAQVITAAQMVIAPDAVADEFARLVRPWRAQIAANLQESRSLAALRDALLPQLLSGEIRLREADRAVDDALRSTGTSTPPERPARPGAGTVHAGAKGRA